MTWLSEPVHLAKLQGRPTVEINPGASEASRVVDIKLPLRAAPAMEAIWQRYLQKQAG